MKNESTIKYLNDHDLLEIGIDWNKTIDAIALATDALHKEDYSQPIKPYLRFGDPRNRIIAMPAFVGGDVNSAGIKWIASFPGNIDKDVPRANSVLILNQVDTGVPEAFINSGLLSAIRTASVSGLVVREVQRKRLLESVVVGITGFGPIGRNHLSMIDSVLGNAISKIRIYDLRPIDLEKIPLSLRDKVEVVDSWQAAYQDADIFMTCTVSKDRYIDMKPKAGSLHLNVSLRDYKAEVLQAIDTHVVDSWEEVCRENTDIEWANKTFGLQKKDTLSISDFIQSDSDDAMNNKKTIMFNPMGMGIYDMAIARHFVTAAEQKKIGTILQGN
jgi:ornithine cyclodeaminase